MTLIQPQPGILDIALYQGGKAHAEGVSNVVKLSANENPLGAAPAAVQAVKDSVSALTLYPSSDHGPLRQAIAEVHGLDVSRIICGVGSDEVLTFLCQAYVGPGTEVVHTEHCFGMYSISTKAAGGTPIQVPERERVIDVDAILAACTERTRLVFIANPNNPTGTMISPAEVARLADGLPDQALLVLDGAYVEYVEGFDGHAGLVDSRQNVVMTRTFSKIYGLGGLRVGWGYGPDHVIDVLNRVRGPFNLSSTALMAAEAAVRDQDWVAYCRTENTRLRGWLSDALAELGVPSDSSCTNYILTRFKDPDEAQACRDFLEGRGLLVRYAASFNLPAALRITVGDENACRRVAEAVRDFKSG